MITGDLYSILIKLHVISNILSELCLVFLIKQIMSSVLLIEWWLLRSHHLWLSILVIWKLKSTLFVRTILARTWKWEAMIVFIFDQGFKKLVSSFKQLLFELKSRGNESIHLQSRIQKATFFVRTIIIRTRKFRVPMKILISKHIWCVRWRASDHYSSNTIEYPRTF